MQDNDEICLCFHVTRRSLEKFIRLEKPVRESQLSECFGAGTGCGWCRPFLKAIYAKANNVEANSANQSETSNQTDLETMDSEDYAAARKEYRQKAKADQQQSD